MDCAAAALVGLRSAWESASRRPAAEDMTGRRSWIERFNSVAAAFSWETGQGE